MPGAGIAIYENVWENPLQSIKDIEMLCSNEGSNISFVSSEVIEDPKDEQHRKTKYRTSKEISISRHKDNKYIKEFDDKCNAVIDLCLDSYRQQMMMGQEPYNAEGFYLLKYDVGDYFNSHYDTHPTYKRSVSVLIYLNDDYEGGEIEFFHFNTKIKPKAGTVILFPPNYPYRHIAHPVTSGTKYAVVTWYHER